MSRQYWSSAVLEMAVYTIVSAIIISECICGADETHIHIEVKVENITEIQNQLQDLKIRQLNFEILNGEREKNVEKIMSDMRQQLTILATTATSLLASTEPPFGCEGIGRNGVHRIRSSTTGDPFYAFCQQAASSDTPDPQPSWTMILRRSENQTSFNRTWEEYRSGFGHVAGDHWIGLERLHEITVARPHELRVELEDFDGEKRYASYARFAIGASDQQYALNVLGEHNGTLLHDSLRYHFGQKFSTFDADHDMYAEGSCAIYCAGGGWFKACNHCHLFGLYLQRDLTPEQEATGIAWTHFHGSNHSLRRARMMIRALG